ncbi:MAG: FtsX-like permease family protein [Acidimicrobiia bacterium]|nr:FtsX-like permease family protein [Acidimicrobiia bacterium]
MANSPTPEDTSRRPLFSLLPILARRLRQDGLSLFFVAVIVLLTSGLLSGIPLFLGQLTTDGLHAALEDAEPAARSVRVTEYAESPSGEGNAWLQRRSEAVLEGLPGLFSGETRSVDQVVDTGDFDAVPMGINPSDYRPLIISMRVQPGAADYAEVIHGRLPQPSAETTNISPDALDPLPPTAGITPELDLTRRPVVEVAIGEAPASELRLEVSDEILLIPRPTSVGLAGSPGTEDAPLVARVAGILRLDPMEDPYWFGDASLHNTGVVQEGLDFVVVSTVLADPSEVTRSMANLPVPLRSEVRVSIDASHLSAAGHGAITEGVRELNDTFESVPVVGGEAAASTGLDQIVDAQLSQRAVAITIMSVAGLAVLVMTGAAVMVTSSFLARKRRSAVALLRSRGITPGQLISLASAEAALVTLPAALLGSVAATILMPGEGVLIPSLMSAAVFVVAGLAMVGATLPDTGRDLNGLMSDRDSDMGTSKVRLVAEIVVLALAVMGVAAVAFRLDDGASIAAGGFDPVILGVPVLVALAGAVVVLRLYHYPLGWVTKVVRRLRGPVVVTALRRVEREPTATAMPLLILALGVGTTIFATIVVTSIDAGQRAAAWQEVGADARIVSGEGGLIPDSAFSLPAGIQAAGTRDVLFIDGVGINTATVPGLLLDAADYQEVIRGTPVGPLPDSLTEDLSTDVIPVLASTNEVAGRKLAVGDRLNMRFGSPTVEAEVVALTDTFPTMPTDGPWLIASREQITAVTLIEFGSNELFLSNPASGVAEAATEDLEVISQQAVETGYRQVPLASGTTRAFAVASGYSALLVALTIGASLVMTARNRRRDLGYLRTLGMSSGQVRAGVALELAVPTVIGVLLGIVSGLAVASLTAPSLNLSAFYSNTIPSLLTVEPLMLAIVALTALVLVGVAAISVAMMVRRGTWLEALRVGDA